MQYTVMSVIWRKGFQGLKQVYLHINAFRHLPALVDLALIHALIKRMYPTSYVNTDHEKRLAKAVLVHQTAAYHSHE